MSVFQKWGLSCGEGCLHKEEVEEVVAGVLGEAVLQVLKGPPQHLVVVLIKEFRETEWREEKLGMKLCSELPGRPSLMLS